MPSTNLRPDEETLARHIRCANDLSLFGPLADGAISDLIARTFPLHPLATFALAQVLSKVAQNERTMFTFLTADDRYTLRTLLERKLKDGESSLVITFTDLWDYFAEAVRSDIGGAGVRKTWNGVANALDKVAPDDTFAQNIVNVLCEMDLPKMG